MERRAQQQRQTAVLRLMVVLVLVLSGCGVAGPSLDVPRSAALQWERLPDPPLSPRALGALLWTGRELLALGGDTAPPCPPTAGCVGPSEPQRDGAAYDPVTNRWRPLAPAPRPLVGPGVLDGGIVWFQTSEDAAPLLAYDAAADSWTEHPAPPGPAAASFILGVSEGRPVALRKEQRDQALPDAVYDPGSRSWEALPPDPLRPSFDRAAVATPQGLLVTGAEAVDEPGVLPAFVRASLLDVRRQTWERLPDSDQLVGAGIAVHGNRAIWPDLGGSDGGQTNGYGRLIPAGGVLDLVTRTWDRLPGAPAEGSGGWSAYALGGAVSAAAGYLYDDRDRSWTRLGRPDGGPSTPGLAAWAGPDLVVVGGLPEVSARAYEHLPGAWILRGAGR